jgi:hypothetical protein
MKALYSLFCHARTVCALVRGIVTLAHGGWAALMPAQLLVLGCGLCIALRILVPSPALGARKQAVFLDQFLCGMAAVSVAALCVTGIVDSGLFLGGLMLGL